MKGRLTKIVTAEEDIRFGSRLLVRGFRASLAEKGFSNAVAVRRHASWIDAGEIVRAGTMFMAELDAASPAIDLQAIANGPIMEPRSLFFPAGLVSVAEAKVREAAQIIGVHRDG